MKQYKLLNISRILILTFLFSLNQSFGQQCGTVTPNSVNTYLQPQLSRAYNYNTNICIDIQFHVIRESDGSFAFTPRNTDDIINELNQSFNEHQIFFNSLGINFIDNSNYINVEENEFNNLTNIDNNPNALNFYLVDDMWDNTAGAAYVASNKLVVRNFWAIFFVATHEVGHSLDLYHTHETDFGVEAIGGSNCFTAGDLICDTPADNRTGTTNGYNPDLTNLMSYYHLMGFTLDHFTNGQGYRMRQAILNNPALQPLVNGSCSISNIDWEYDNGASVCLNQNKIFQLTNIPPTVSVNWSVTNNLNIVSSISNSITVRLNSLNNEAIITGTVIIDDLTYIFTLELKQLSIPTSSKITLESFRSDPIYTDRWTNITAKYNWLIDVGQLGYTWEWIVPSHQIRYQGDNISYILVNPLVQMSSVYIKTRASNVCGCSDWKGKWFTVEDPPNGCTSCPTKPGEIHY